MTQHAECGVWVRDRLRRALPRGTPLPDADWSRRHVVIGVRLPAAAPDPSEATESVAARTDSLLGSG